MNNDDLIKYLAAQERARERRVLQTLGNLTEREALLVREAAIIGYVEGRQDEKVFQEDRWPSDAAILHMSVIGALAAHDANRGSFRLLAAAEMGERPEASRSESERGLPLLDGEPQRF